MEFTVVSAEENSIQVHLFARSDVCGFTSKFPAISFRGAEKYPTAEPKNER